MRLAPSGVRITMTDSRALLCNALHMQHLIPSRMLEGVSAAPYGRRCSPASSPESPGSSPGASAWLPASAAWAALPAATSPCTPPGTPPSAPPCLPPSQPSAVARLWVSDPASLGFLEGLKSSAIASKFPSHQHLKAQDENGRGSCWEDQKAPSRGSTITLGVEHRCQHVDFMHLVLQNEDL